MTVTRYQSGCSYGLQASVSSPWALAYLLNSIVFAMSAVTLVVRSELFKRYHQMLCKVFLKYSDKTEPKTSQWMLDDQICNMSAIQIGLLSALQHLCYFPAHLYASISPADCQCWNISSWYVSWRSKGGQREPDCERTLLCYTILLYVCYMCYTLKHYWHTVWLPQLNALIDKPLSICA